MNVPKYRIATSTVSAISPRSEEQGLSPWMTFLLAGACGLTVANLYYAQPVAGPIGAALGLSVQWTGLIVTMTQVGYGAGLIFVVPLSDLMENRRLTLIMLAATACFLLGAALSVTHCLSWPRHSS
jgi:MFS family permease